MAEVVYNVGKTRLVSALTDGDGANLRMCLIITSKTGAADPDLGTLAAIDAVGTVALHTERVTLTSPTATQDNTNDRANLDTANATFAAAPGVSALAAVIYDEGGGTDATRYPITFHDTNFGSGVPLDGGLVVNIADWLRIN